MDVYLVRHAVAERRDPARWPDDALRPLTPDGIERFRSVAGGLRRIVPSVDVVLASPYTRAWQTAELLHSHGGWPRPERCAALVAEEAPGAAFEVLERERGRSSVALVGHEPFLSSLASLLLAGDEDAGALELKKGAVAFLALADRPTAGSAVLRWSASPKLLRLLATSAEFA